MSENVSLVVVAGEPSGDRLGAQLIGALKRRSSSTLRITGVGGENLKSQGLQSLFPIDDIAIMGISQIATRLPKLLGFVSQVVDHVMETNPSAVLLIDSPGFNHPIAKRLKKRGFEGAIIKYVAPQVWASRPWRARHIARYIDFLLTLFPFEPKYFEPHGLRAQFVGHPVTERPIQAGMGPAFRREHNIPETAPLLCVLPGSRSNEVRFLLPVFIDALEILRVGLKDLHVVVPTTPNVASAIRVEMDRCNAPVTFVTDEVSKFQAFDASNVAIAASGTVSLELGLARTPMVIAYKIGSFSAFVFRRFLLLPYITLINIILERFAIPELVQEDCTPEKVASAISELFSNSELCQKQIHDIGLAMSQLTVSGQKPDDAAAQAVLDILKDRGAVN